MSNYFKSPMNYMGGKHKLLPQIEPLFPEDIEVFVDLFCGGLDVSLNVKSKKKICNDLEPHIIDFYTNIQKCSGEEVHNKLIEIVKEANELDKDVIVPYETLVTDLIINKAKVEV